MIHIIDAPCGAGKTSWAIQEMKRAPEKKYVYCTPLLDEIDRIIKACPMCSFKQPQNWGKSKLESYNELLKSGENIAVTHTTFLNATDETIRLIEEGGYTLMMDEAPDIVQEFNRSSIVENDATQRLGNEDISLLQDVQLIEIDEGGRVAWVGGHYSGKYEVAERYARGGRLYLAGGTLAISVCPPALFQAFQDIYVFTYLLEGAPLKPYLDIYGMRYEKLSVMRDVGESYTLRPYTADGDAEFRKICREHIHLLNNRELLKSYQKTGSLSKTWYQKYCKGGSNREIVALKKHVSYFFRYLAKARVSELISETNERGEIILHTPIMWTCPADYESKIHGTGYTEGRRYSSRELAGLTVEEVKKLKETTTGFVPCNARASNKYRLRWALAYLVNMYYSPEIAHFFRANGVALDGDAFAVSCLIQWVCRSRIRDGKPIELYLPSERMRQLYERWLDGGFS